MTSVSSLDCFVTTCWSSSILASLNCRICNTFSSLASAFSFSLCNRKKRKTEVMHTVENKQTRNCAKSHLCTTMLIAWVRSGEATCSRFHSDQTNSLSDRACESSSAKRSFSLFRATISCSEEEGSDRRRRREKVNEKKKEEDERRGKRMKQKTDNPLSPTR